MSTAIMKKSGPFAHGISSVQRTMFLVLLALTPATLFNLYLFGWPAILLFIVTLGACVAVEAACLALAGKPVVATLADCSAILTGWLLAMSLPPWAPWWIGVLAAIFAIALTKHAFGGLGQNLFNPAMVGRTVMLISFPVAMTVWVAPHPLFSAGAPGLVESFAITFGGSIPDTMSAASALGYIKTELSRGIPVTQSMGQMPDLMDMALGYRAGSMGETSASTNQVSTPDTPGGPGITAELVDVRTGRQDGYERVVFEFSTDFVPGYTVGYVEGPITADPSDLPVCSSQVIRTSRSGCRPQPASMRLPTPSDVHRTDEHLSWLSGDPVRRRDRRLRRCTELGDRRTDTSGVQGHDPSRSPTRVVVDVASAGVLPEGRARCSGARSRPNCEWRAHDCQAGRLAAMRAASLVAWSLSSCPREPASVWARCTPMVTSS